MSLLPPTTPPPSQHGQGSFGESPLISAIKQLCYNSSDSALYSRFQPSENDLGGSLKRIDELTRCGAHLQSTDPSGETPLMIAAAQTRHPEVLELLIGNGAPVNAVNPQGKTALMIAAAWNNSSAILEMLLDQGADPKCKDHEGKMAIDYAKENYALSHSAVCKRLSQASS